MRDLQLALNHWIGSGDAEALGRRRQDGSHPPALTAFSTASCSVEHP